MSINLTPTDVTGYKFSDQIGHLLRRAYQRHVAIFEQSVPDKQLTAGQFVVLCSIRGDVHDIAGLVGATAIEEDSVRGIVERLKWRKLVRVEHPAGDARQMSIELTAEGMAIVERTIPFAADVSEVTFGALDVDERASLLALLRKMSGI